MATMKINFLKILLFALVMFVIGEGVILWQIGKLYFTKQEIMDAHGSFDERLNLIDERVAVLEDSTKSGELQNK